MKRLALVIACATVAHAAAGRRTPGPVSTKELVARAAAYVRGYERDLTYLLADEQYLQQDTVGAVHASRVMRGDTFFLFLPGSREWISVRDVAEVDGVPVADRGDMKDVLESRDFLEAARGLKDANARFNLGGIYRNFNEPTLALLTLDDVHRSRFSFGRGPSAGPGAIVTFKETDRPTLIRDARGRDVASKGEIVLDDDTGRVRQTTLRISLNAIDVTLQTFYDAAPDLGLFVPRLFIERYVDSKRGEEITCEATYTNYRRFDVQVHIKGGG